MSAMRKLKPVEAGDGSYGGMVLSAFDNMNCDHGIPVKMWSACRVPGNELMQADEDSWAVQADFDPAQEGPEELDEAVK